MKYTLTVIDNVFFLKSETTLINLNTNDKKSATFLATCLNCGFLKTPEEMADYYLVDEQNSENQEPVYLLDYEKVNFTFLKVPDTEDKAKVETINKILTKKVVAVLKEGPSRYSELSHRFNMQLKCSTCQAYGIGDQGLADALALLSP